MKSECDVKLSVEKASESHYNRNKSARIYLSCELNLKKLYQMYNTRNNDYKVSLTMFKNSQAKRGSTEVGSALLHHLRSLDTSNIETVRLFCDGCGGQNKNSYIIHVLAYWLLESPMSVKNIIIHFPVRGHSYLPADRAFGRVEKLLKRKNLIISPEEYNEVYSNVGKVSLLFFLTFVIYTMRYSVSIAIVAMTQNSTTISSNEPTYNWTDKNIVLSSFFWGYVIPQVFMGVVTKHYSTKRILIISMTINFISCICTPVAVFKFGPYGMMTLRALQGVAQGSTVPAIYNVLAHWAPPAERSFLGAFSWSGNWGWPSSFYFNGAIGFIWLVSWILLAADTPYDDKFISEAEKKYITSSIDPEEEMQHKNIPWKNILTSLPFLGITLSQFGSSWGDNISLTEMPFYISKILKYDIEAVTCLGPAVCLISLSCLPDSATVLSCLMMVLHQSFSAAYYGGISMNYVDISPNYCAILVSITNAICTMCDIAVPLLVQVVVIDETDKSQWQIIFLLAAAMYIFAAIAFIFLGSVETQLWDYTDNFKSSPEVEKSKCNLDKNEI
nr:unnamed protein product [Callosobruchus chinensis]